MKKVVCVFFFGALFSCYGQDWQTGGRANGRYWQSLTVGEKTAMLVGMHNVVLEALPRNRYDSYFPTGITFGEIVKAVDGFFDTPENALITVTGALLVAARRFNGADPVAVEAFISGMRRGAKEISAPAKSQ